MLALGTVQFGQSYGIANKTGQVKPHEIKLILNKAQEFGIDTIDTATTYGDSEKSLGNAGVKDWKIVTKIPEIPFYKNKAELRGWLRNSIEQSLKRLRIETLYGVLLHRPNQLLDDGYNSVWDELNSLKENGLIQKIGYSIYNPSELDDLFALYKPTIIQAPYNIFDRNLEVSGWLKKLFENNIEVHTRSCFLQGLLLMNPSDRPSNLNKWQEIWDTYDKWIKKNNISRLEACLSFVTSEKRISKIVIGVDNLKQFQEITSLIETKRNIKFLDFNVSDERLINPSKWISS